MPDRYPAIEDHAVIGDLHTVALVATDGTIDWCCLPRFDSPAVFASVLDSGRGGCFAVRSGAVRTRQLYKPGTNVLVTRFLGTGSVGEVVDFTVPRHPGIPLMRPGPVLVRGQRAVRGTVVFTITCRPAFDFGRQDHAVHAPDHGGAVFTSPGAQVELVLRGSQRFSVAGPPPRQRSPWALRRAWTCCWSGVARTAETRGEGPQTFQLFPDTAEQARVCSAPHGLEGFEYYISDPTAHRARPSSSPGPASTTWPSSTPSDSSA